MNILSIPPPLIDLNTLPAPIMTSDAGSFAYNTFKRRVPLIIDEIIALNRFTPDINAAMYDLRNEITDGVISELTEETEDKGFWNLTAQPWVGRSWLDVPWYWAEAFFYRRVLQASQYFLPGPQHYVDPYHPHKQAELLPAAAPRVLESALRTAPADQAVCFETLLHRSLWGNRTDLSYNVANTIGQTRLIHEERQNILVDDSQLIWDTLNTRKYSQVIVITDNAGTELLMDLALVDFILTHHLADQVVLHVKPYPFFVSDTMEKDVLESVSTLSIGSESLLRDLGQRLSMHLEHGTLVLYTHWFYGTSLFYFQMPGDLCQQISNTDLVILKGDVNYRRLLGDAHWPPTCSFAQVTAYFPTPFVALRTLKAELIIGLAQGQAERLSEQDPGWRVKGRLGIIQSRLTST